MLKVEKFNVTKFLAVAREAREEALEMLNNPVCKDIRMAYRLVMDEADYTDVEFVAEAVTEQDMRDSMEIAARRAQGFGATKEQIDMIVDMARHEGRFQTFTGLLTSGEASAIIGHARA